MSVVELRAWATHPTIRVTVLTSGQTLQQAWATFLANDGDDVARADILTWLNAVDPAAVDPNDGNAPLAEPRGVIAWATFNAEWTPAQEASLTPGQTNWLNAARLDQAGIDVNGPSIEGVLLAKGFAVTQPVSPVRYFTARQVATADDLYAAVNRLRQQREERRACTNGSRLVEVALFIDGVETGPRYSCGHTIPGTVADVSAAGAWTETEINRALQGVQP